MQNFIIQNITVNAVLQHLDICWIERIRVICNDCLEENENVSTKSVYYMMDKIFDYFAKICENVYKWKE